MASRVLGLTPGPVILDSSIFHVTSFYVREATGLRERGMNAHLAAATGGPARRGLHDLAAAS